MTILKLTLALVALYSLRSSAFVPNSPDRNPPRLPTRIFLEDRIAEMIDQELYRQTHKKDFERQWMEKNRGAVLHTMGESYGGGDSESLMTFDEKAEAYRQHRRDLKMASDDPERYCADRCVTTGNCDIFEDFYHLSPEQVLNFCEECVLSNDGECDLPEDFYEVGKLTP